MKRARGQATAELALCALVLVPVLVTGVHFAELGWVSVKAHEAAASALWDSTGLRAHDFTQERPELRVRAPAALLDVHGRNPGARASWLYRDFDGREGGGGSGVRLAAAGAEAPVVTCRSRLLTTPLSRPRPVEAAFPLPREAGAAVDALGCTARTLVRPLGFSSRTVPLCGVGRADASGECRAELVVAIDDWALQGSGARFGNEQAQCALERCENTAFHATANRLYRAFGGAHGSAASRLSDFTVQRGSPVVEDQFFLSYRGEDDATKPFAEETGAEAGTASWATTPFSAPYRAAWESRGGCFLGAPCNRPLF